MSPRAGRILELDIAKGLGILSVILYHTLPASPLHTALGGYMMPLFFVVSGLVMQRDACSFSLRRFWEKNARLLFYYILFSAIYLLCSAVTCIAGHGSYKALALDGIAAFFKYARRRPKRTSPSRNSLVKVFSLPSSHADKVISSVVRCSRPTIRYPFLLSLYVSLRSLAISPKNTLLIAFIRLPKHII